MALRDELPYCPFYCEENAWKLCQDPRIGSGPRAVLWITNDERHVALFAQRVAPRGQPVVWDYHVVVVVGCGPDATVWDSDTRLPFPAPISDYLDVAFPPVPAAFAARFRWVEADTFLQTFGSDRRHMIGDDGEYLRPPPPWSMIGEGHELDAYLDLSRPSPGEVLTLAELRAKYE